MSEIIRKDPSKVAIWLRVARQTAIGLALIIVLPLAISLFRYGSIAGLNLAIFPGAFVLFYVIAMAVTYTKRIDWGAALKLRLAIILPWLFAAHAMAADAPEALHSPDPIDNFYIKPDQLVLLPDGRKIHLVCSGAGSPTVILTAGFSDWSAQWSKVYDPISKLSRTCSWDRAGYGFSDPSPLPQDIKHTTADLEAALQALKISGPYLVVGHSMGGLESLRFADLHPDKVAGMVLVDPSIPDQARRREFSALKYAAAARKGETQYVKKKNICAGEIEGGALTTTSADPDSCFSYNSSYRQELKDALREMDANPARWRTRASLGSLLGANFTEIINHKRNYGGMPLRVLTAGDPWVFPSDFDSAAKTDAPAFQAELLRENNILAALSTNGANIIVSGTSHYIQLDKPEVVVSTVSQMIEAIRLSQKHK